MPGFRGRIGDGAGRRCAARPWRASCCSGVCGRTTFGGFDDETDDTVARTTNGKAAEELELEGLGLGLGAKTTVLDTLGVKLDSAISKVETLLDDRGELADTLSLLAENVLGTGGTDDDLSAVGSGTDLNTGVAILGKLTSEKLVELRVEDAVSDELPLGGHLRASGLHGGNCCSRVKCRLWQTKVGGTKEKGIKTDGEMKNSSFEVKVGHAIGKFVHFPCLPLFLSPYLAESTVRPPKSLLPTSLRSLLN